jgi:cardiolipin synthase
MAVAAGRREWTGGPALAAVSLALLAGCATTPGVSPEIGRPAAAEKPEVVGARGPLSNDQVKALIAKLTLAPGDNALLRHHMAIEQAVAETPLVEGETTHLLRDGPATFRAMFAAMKAAKHRIDLEYYIFEDVESDGVQLSDLLIAERQAGVAVNVIYDSYGSGQTPHALFDRLGQAGVNVVEYNPINPLKAKAGWSPNQRDHRKILVVDRTTAIVGGVNLATEYEPHPLSKSGGDAGEHWRDTDLLITGPAVAQLEALFQAHWSAQQGPPLLALELPPKTPPATGQAVVRIIGSSPAQETPRYYVTLISAIRSAEKSITASTAYFVPTNDEVQALVEAAQRGVEVRLLLPGHSDSSMALAVGHSRYGPLLKAGVKIYETQGLVLHSKTVTIDGVWSVIGSSNFDHRSVIFNDEVDAVVLGGDVAQDLEAMFADDIAAARSVSLEQWESRSTGERFRESFGRIWESLL